MIAFSSSSARIKFAALSLARVSDMAKPQGKNGGDYRVTKLGVDIQNLLVPQPSPGADSGKLEV